MGKKIKLKDTDVSAKKAKKVKGGIIAVLIGMNQATGGAGAGKIKFNEFTIKKISD